MPGFVWSLFLPALALFTVGLGPGLPSALEQLPPDPFSVLPRGKGEVLMKLSLAPAEASSSCESVLSSAPAYVGVLLQGLLHFLTDRAVSTSVCSVTPASSVPSAPRPFSGYGDRNCWGQTQPHRY